MVRKEKVEEVEKLKKLIEDYPSIGILEMHKMPARQLQQIKKVMKEDMVIKVTKKSLIGLAIKNSNKTNITSLEQVIPKQPALFFTNVEPFKFYMMINKLRFPTFAKGGDVALNDIKISQGPTGLLAGPAISELSKVGIPVGVEEGKIAVKKDVVIVKKGDVISKELASALKKLGIETMEIKLDLVTICDNGNVYQKETLELVNTYPEKMKVAFNEALNLSVNICYPTKENIQYLLSKAYGEASVLNALGGAK